MSEGHCLVCLEPFPCSCSKVALKRGARIRVRTDRLPMGQRVRGADTHVEVLLEDGTVLPFPDVESVFWLVDGRSGYASAHFVAHGVELDVEGENPGRVAAVDTLLRIKDMKIRELETQIEHLRVELRERLEAYDR